MHPVAVPTEYRFPSCDPADVVRLQRDLECSEAVAWILARRNIVDAPEAREFLDDDVKVNAFHDPLLLGDISAAVERIHFAIAEKQPIVVHGDYDADGVCATTLLVEALEFLGGDVQAFLPSRFENGYGLHIDSVEKFAISGCRLLITVDCGISAVEAVAQAVDRGLDVIICDHHQPADELPSAIICSTRPSDYPFPDLCATGAVGKLVQALGAPYGDAQHELEAIATIGDVVPLVGENRAIVRRGLEAMRRTTRPGLRALLSTCDVHATDVQADDVAFRVVPRLNAVGRLAESERAYEMLRASDPAVAESIARELFETNEERKRIERAIVAEAIECIEALPAAEQAAKGYVVSGRGWHEGVVGIVAARLVDRFHRPVVVISEQDPLARGSARSIPGFDLHEALSACTDHLSRWGGHTGAAGVTIEPGAITAFRAAFAAAAEAQIGDRPLGPIISVDAVVGGDEISMELAEQVQQLAPFGHGNPRPVLLVPAATARDVQVVGADQSHLRCTVATGGHTVSSIGFGLADRRPDIELGQACDIAAHIDINRFRGGETVQLQLLNISPTSEEITDPGAAAVHKLSCVDGCIDAPATAGAIQQLVLDGHPWDAFDPEATIAFEPLLACATTRDLRHRNRSITHIVRLLTAGQSVLVVTADVRRRRKLLDGALNPARFGAITAEILSDGCSQAGNRSGQRPTGSDGHSAGGSTGQCLTLAEYGAVARLSPDNAARFDAIVVLDPPTTAEARDALLAVGIPLHLVFGAAEQRFAVAITEAFTDMRATCVSFWRSLQANGELTVTEIASIAAVDDPELTRNPAALAYGLRELKNRSLVDADWMTGTVALPAAAIRV